MEQMALFEVSLETEFMVQPPITPFMMLSEGWSQSQFCLICARDRNKLISTQTTIRDFLYSNFNFKLMDFLYPNFNFKLISNNDKNTNFHWLDLIKDQ